MRPRWDCHVHAFGAVYPPAVERGYDPPLVTAAECVAEAAEAGFARVVWVQPSAYGMDNAAQLDALDAFPEASRAVIAPPPEGTDLAALHGRGVRGLRVNLLSAGGNGIETIAPYERAMTDLGWHVAAFLDATTTTALDDLLAATARPIVLDHFAGASKADDPRAFDAVLRHMAGRRIWVKLSAVYRLGAVAPDVVAALVRRFVEAGADRLLFASNWPHVQQKPGYTTAALAAQMAGWIGQAGLDPERVFADNPATLYE